ncbi:larval serum protein 1 beta chain [Drosophila bipectinata]|uniref:larval serum protein 1 beta chain n=1 Tax=Drosophila bipectinata TaxID=42026 RepID=UPI0038B23EB3
MQSTHDRRQSGIQNRMAPRGANARNRYYLEKEQFLIEILHHVHEPLMNDQWRLLGEQLVTDKDQYVIFNDRMTAFLEAFSMGKLLDQKAYYNPLYEDHYQQTLGLYNFFYNTRDWYTLWQNICWARLHMNPGLFVQALTQVLLKRDDYQPLIMPKIYELWPESFLDMQTVREARNFNFANWIREGNMTDFKEVHPLEMEPLEVDGDLRNTPEWLKAMAGVTIFRMKQRPSGNKLGYLVEDVDWLAYWYYLNTGINLVEDKSDQFQEWWYYQLGQILARYKLERYGQKMSYERLQFIKDERNSQLISWQNLRFSPENQKTTNDINDYLERLESMVNEAITSQSLLLKNGTFIDLSINNNWLIGLKELFPYEWTQFQMDTANQPQLLLDLRTALRSENFYYYADRLLQLYRCYNEHFQPSTERSFIPTNLKINDVKVSPLITFDQPVDIDLSNLLHTRHFHFGGQFLWPFTLQQRQFRLQQKDFSYTLQVSSNITKSTIFKIYLTIPEGKSINRQPFYLLDSFLTMIYQGDNRITRNSLDFKGFVGDHISLTELNQFVKLAQNEEFDFPLNISTANCGFPRRLILPRGGLGNPLKMRLFIVATSYDFKAQQGNELNCDITKGISRWDELPLGYPFERYLEEDHQAEEVFGSHVLWKDVEIWHEDHLA